MTTAVNAMGIDRLDDVLDHVELHLEELAEALRSRDAEAVDRSASLLHGSLATAIESFSAAAGQGRVPESLRQRLARASAQVAAHRESLARATAALDRAIDVLLPQDRSGVPYGVTGRRDRPSLGRIAV